MNKFKKVYDTSEVKKQMDFYKERMFNAKDMTDWKHWSSAYISACNEFERRIKAKKTIENTL